MLGGRDATCSYQHRPALPVNVLQPSNNDAPLVSGRREYLLGQGDALGRFVGGYANHGESIDGKQLRSDLVRSTCHASEAEVAAEKTLVTDSSNGGFGVGQVASFLGFDELVEAELPGTVRHGATGVLVNDLNLPLAYQVIMIPRIEHLGTQSLSHPGFADSCARPGFTKAGGRIGQPSLPARSQFNIANSRGDAKVQFLAQCFRQLERLGIVFGALIGRHRLGQDERCACLVDQDAVSFIDDGEAKPAE